jgi:hypothetical protein
MAVTRTTLKDGYIARMILRARNQRAARGKQENNFRVRPGTGPLFRAHRICYLGALDIRKIAVGILAV